MQATIDRPTIADDAQRLIDTLERGGVAIMPGDVGYGLLASTEDAARKSFNAKRRASNKRHAMVGNMDIHSEVHVVTPQARTIIDTLTLDYGIPLGIVAEFRRDHPLVKQLSDSLLSESTVNNTLAMLVNNGRFQEECARVSMERCVPMLGSSANLTGTGPRFRLDDIQPEIRAVADIEFDYGLRKFHLYRRSSTIIDFTTMQVVRIGALYDIITEVFATRFGIDLPEDPGFDTLPSGHLRKELA